MEEPQDHPITPSPGSSGGSKEHMRGWRRRVS